MSPRPLKSRPSNNGKPRPGRPATLKKKLAALEKEADKMRADYGGMGDVLQALSGTMEAELTAIAGYLNSYGDHAQW